MAQSTRGALRAKLAALCQVNNDSGSDSEAYLNDDLNVGARRVWGAHPWIEREGETVIFTVAPYTTGTFAVTQGGTTLTGSGTTWTSAMTGRKFAKAIGNPFYRFTFVSTTSATIPTGGYAEATETAGTYSLFQDEYDLAATFESIVSAQILYRPGGGLDETTEAEIDDRLYVTGASGPPRLFAPVLATTAGIRRIRLWPIPDTIYRVRVRGLIAYRDMTQDGDLCMLGAKKERALLLAAALEVQRRGDGRPVTSNAEVEAAIAEQRAAEAVQQPLSVTRNPPLGGHGRGMYIYLKDPV